MNILLIGSGGREHALAWKMAQSPKLKKLYIAPGNAGTSEVAENVNISVNDFKSIGEFSLEKKIDMLVVGPEEPLVRGIYNYFLKNQELKSIPVIGPDKIGAQLEGSKDFAKKFMNKHNIPTAAHLTVTENNYEQGISFLEKQSAPYVLKADGLAAGKGVIITPDINEAKELLKEYFGGKFGEAGKKVVIEEFLSGIELSVFVLTDGVGGYVILPEAKDYKRIGEGDTGLNTGGMGAISPVPFANDKFMQEVEETIVKPTIQGLKKDNITYKGFIFIGLIKVNDKPYVIEYNVRMGDPETQVVIPRLKTDLVELFEKVATGTLSDASLKIDDRATVTVIAVSGGYPEEYEKNKEITGLNSIMNSTVFHAGTKIEGDKVLSSGGRVLAITSYGETKEEALEKSYQSLTKLHFDKMYFRKDIGFDLN